MIFSNEDIKKALEQGHITITPTPEADQYTTSALDLTLGDSFKVWDKDKLGLGGFDPVLDLSLQNFLNTANAFLIDAPRETDNSVILKPYSECKHHLLAMTREKIHLKREFGVAARVEGRSSLARLGLTVHLTAPTIQSGFKGPITLEIINVGPFHIKFVPNKTKICQLIFEKLQSTASIEIATAFLGQTSPAGKSAKKKRK